MIDRINMKRLQRVVSGRWMAFILCCVANLCCQQKPPAVKIIKATYSFLEPAYDNIRLVSSGDTLNFALDEHTYNTVGSFSHFIHNGTAYIAFYDKGSKSFSVYDFASQQLVRRIPLKKWVNSTKLDKASMYIKDFDSIFVTTQTKLYLLDSTGTEKKRFEFPEESDKRGFFSNVAPPVMVGNMLYMSIRPLIDEKSVEAQQKWRVLYGINVQSGEKERYYQLPETYQKNLYGYSFLDYSYCFNDRGNFVFSFAADTNIYETNLKDYHRAYYARSRFQSGPIKPVTKDDLRHDDSYKLYTLRDSYGPIFYDRYKKRYLRQAKQKISEADFLAKNTSKKRTIIIFNEQFKIIGESETNEQFSFSSLFFTKDGGIYARINPADEHALHFVRLVYEEKTDDPVKLAQHPIPTSK